MVKAAKFKFDYIMDLATVCAHNYVGGFLVLTAEYILMPDLNN